MHVATERKIALFFSLIFYLRFPFRTAGESDERAGRNVDKQGQLSAAQGPRGSRAQRRVLPSGQQVHDGPTAGLHGAGDAQDES